VANEKSISKAAEKLYISPSAISQSITQLEKELDITIFNRSRLGTTPTPEGNIVVSKAINILANIKYLHDELNSLKQPIHSHLKITIAPAFFDIFQEVITGFNIKNPHGTIEIEELFNDDMLKNFSYENFDVGFLPAQKEDLDKLDKLGKQLIHKGIIAIVVGRNSRLYDLDSVTPTDLNNEKLVLLKKTNNYYVKQLSKDIENQVIMTTNNPRLLLNFVKESTAFTFIHEFTIKNYSLVQNGELKLIPIKTTSESDYIYQDIWAIYSQIKGLSHSSEELIKHILAQVNK
jgi:DNA-binding transcriptional LysR family regulator